MVQTQGRAFDREESVRLRIDGMTCDHCRRSVEERLQSQPGVEATDVNLKVGEAVVRGHGLDAAGLCDAVSDLGYSAHPA